MKKILALALFAVALVSCRQTMQTDGFKLSGHLEGLQVGDTLFLNLKSATTRLYDTEAKIICIVSKKGVQCIECHHKDI